ncbi:MAG: GvpL/GvpF family gas vesicle protein [Candidatus Aenigmarchaeota archaeon]|nr:GvpL/GvpF family gas vesicle protein [Candidatus Aenigmarchaeota archaeon]
MAEYLYCIINRTKLNGFPEEGIEGGRPYALPYHDLCAIASEVPLKDYEPTDDNVARHKDVELCLLKEHTVLPVAFGMVFRTKGILVNTMRNVYPILKRSLRLIDNKIELGVKVVAPKEGKDVKEDIPLDTGIPQEMTQAVKEEDFAVLDRIVVEVRRGELFSDRLLYNKSFLVDKRDIEKFSEEVERLGQKYKECKIKYSGPWPPYNFVDIRIMGRRR